MKSEKTYNGLTLEYYNEIGNITFYIEGTHAVSYTHLTLPTNREV